MVAALWGGESMTNFRTARTDFPTRRSATVITAAIIALALSLANQAAGKTLRLAHTFSEDNSTHVAAERMGEIVKEQTGGSLEIRVLGNSQLGSDRQIMEGLMLGTIDMANITNNIVQGYEPIAGLTALPYLIRNFDEAFRIEDGEIGKEIDQRILSKIGLRVVGYTATGFRVLVTRSKPVQSLADFKGLKIRVPESPIMVQTFKALGANPTPIPWGEVYTALQTNVVDACEAPPKPLSDSKIFEIGKAVSLTNHIYTGQFVLISEKVFQSLSEKERQAILEGGRQSTKWQREQAVKEQSEPIEQAQRNLGVSAYTVDTAPLQKGVAPVYQDYSKTIGGMTLIDAILKM
jgi:tripartite ATP-independent transporter DctP family solute receptor